MSLDRSWFAQTILVRKPTKLPPLLQRLPVVPIAERVVRMRELLATAGFERGLENNRHLAYLATRRAETDGWLGITTADQKTHFVPLTSELTDLSIARRSEGGDVLRVQYQHQGEQRLLTGLPGKGAMLCSDFYQPIVGLQVTDPILTGALPHKRKDLLPVVRALAGGWAKVVVYGDCTSRGDRNYVGGEVADLVGLTINAKGEFEVFCPPDRGALPTISGKPGQVSKFVGQNLRVSGYGREHWLTPDSPELSLAPAATSVARRPIDDYTER